MAQRLISLSVGTKDTEDYLRTFQDISELGRNLAESHGYVNVTASIINDSVDDDPELVYTKHTLARARKAIEFALKDTVDPDMYAEKVLNELRDAGIWIRETR